MRVPLDFQWYLISLVEMAACNRWLARSHLSLFGSGLGIFNLYADWPILLLNRQYRA